MATITLTLTDRGDRGEVILNSSLDGLLDVLLEKDYLTTPAMTFAVAISRLFKAQALTPLVPLVCDDLMTQMKEWRAAKVVASSEPSAIPPALSEDGIFDRADFGRVDYDDDDELLRG